MGKRQVAMALAWVLAGGAMAAAIPATTPAPAPSAWRHLYVATEEAAPASMLEGGRVVGSASDKVRTALARAGLQHTMALLPWKRAYHAALSRPDACVYSTSRTPERERLFKWVAPTATAAWVLMGHADRPLRIERLDDARGLRIGTYHGDARDHYLRAQGFTVDAAPSDLLNPGKLLQGRIDLWAASLPEAAIAPDRHGWDRRIVPVLVFRRIALYLACNPALPDPVVERLRAEFARMERDGTMQEIERSYAGWSGAAKGRTGP